MSKIFLSHSSHDNFAAVAMRDWLASEGWDDVFLDLDPIRGIAAGERWENALHVAANRCEAVLFLVSANWLESRWCLREYNLARALNKKLFAVLIDVTTKFDDLPPDLKGTWQAINVVSGQDGKTRIARLPGSHEEGNVVFSHDGLRRLKRGLEAAGLDPKFFAWPPEAEPDRPPYRGLKPLEAADAGIFFGREAPIIEASDRLRGLKSAAPPRLLVILGASGAGKSSFLRAGLLPRLQRDDRNFIPLPIIRPERAALSGENGLLRALEAALPTRDRAELRKAMEAGAEALRPLLRELASPSLRAREMRSISLERSNPGAKSTSPWVASPSARNDGIRNDEGQRPPTILLAIDQAEELFRPEGRAEGEALLALIRDLTQTDDPAIIAIFAIRSDSYDALEHAKPLEGLPQSTLPLLPMPRGSYREVIEGPARRYVQAGKPLNIEPRLVERLLADVAEGGGADALPLLAFTLEQLFADYRRSGSLTLNNYEEFGGLKGAIDAAVNRAFRRADADPRIPADRKARETLLRRGLIPWLAGIDPDSKTPRRNIARRAEIPAEAAPLIDLLVEERLLSTDIVVGKDASGAETRFATIEPAHEALLRQWGLLQGWLEEDFGLLATLEGVKRAAMEWEANGGKEAWLAHQGQRLAEARGLDARGDIAAKLEAGDRGYLAACAGKEEAARAEAEARRREREEEQARRLTDAQAIASANRGIAQRTRIGLIAALILLATAMTVGGVAWHLRDVASEQAAIATQKAREAEIERGKAVEASEEASRQKNAATAAAAEADKQRKAAEIAAEDANAQRDSAKAAAQRERMAKYEAIKTRNDALLNQSQYLSNLAEQQRDSQDEVTAALLALEALPDASSPDEIARTRPYWRRAEGPLNRALESIREAKIIQSQGAIGENLIFTSDGKGLYVALKDNFIQIWDVSAGVQIKKIPLINGFSVALCQDGKKLLTGSRDGTVTVFDVSSGTIIRKLAMNKLVHYVTCSPNGEEIFATDIKTIKVWNARTGDEILNLDAGENSYFLGGSINSNSNNLLAWGADVRVIDLNTHSEVFSIKHGANVSAGKGVFSPDNEKIAIFGGHDNAVQIVNATTGKSLTTLSGHRDVVESAVFTFNSKGILTGSSDKTVRLWDAENGFELAQYRGFEGVVAQLAFNTDSKSFLTRSYDGTVRLWETALGAERNELNIPNSTALSVALHPSHNYAAIGLRNGTSRLMDLTSHKEVLRFEGHTGSVLGLDFSPDGKQLATASADKTVRIWDVNTGEIVRILRGHTKAVRSVHFVTGGLEVISGSEDKTIRIWDISTGDEHRRIDSPDEIFGVAVSKDVSTIISFELGGTIRIWDIATSRERSHFGQFVDALALSVDGRNIVTESMDGLEVWDISAPEQPVRKLSKYSARPGLAVALSADGRRIAAGSPNGNITIFDADTLEYEAELNGHRDNIYGLAFNAGGTILVSASADSTARVWSARTGQSLIELAHDLVPRCLTSSQRKEFFLPNSSPAWCGYFNRWPY